MIQLFQRFSQSRAAKIFLGLVALSFMVFGGNSLLQRGGSHAVVAEVGSLSISRAELAKKVHDQVQAMMAQSPTSVTPDELIRSGLPQQVLDLMIHTSLLNLEATRLGLVVSDEALRERVHTLKAFQEADGTFSHARFSQILKANGFSEDGFLQDVREEMLREQLINAVIVGVKLPSDLLEALFDIQYQRRGASMRLVVPQDMPVPAAPSTKVLEAFYTKHKKAFTTPELRTLTVLVLDPAAIAATIAVAAEDIKAIYETNGHKEPFEQVKASIADALKKERANEALYKITQDLDDRLAGGATFAELATAVKEVNLLKLELVDNKGQVQGEIRASSLPKESQFAQELLQSAFELAQDADTPFIQAKNGVYYAVKVDKVIPPTLQPFAKRQAFVLKTWQEAEQFKIAHTKVQEELKKFQQGSGTLQGLKPLPAVSLDKPSPTVSDAVKDLIFSLQPGQAGMAILPEGIAMVRLNTVTSPGEKVRQEKMAVFQSVLLDQYKTDVLTAYTNALRIRYPLKINSEALQSFQEKAGPAS